VDRGTTAAEVVAWYKTCVAGPVPVRPDDGRDVPILDAPRKHTSRQVLAFIVASVIAFIILSALALNALLNSQERQVENLWQGIQ
jgi:hypothetical protein